MTRLPPQDTFANAPHPEWDEQAAAACADELSLRALTSRWIGGDPTLALYGGGNTSVKAPWTAAGASAPIALFVKGSGADLAEVTPRDFTPVALDGALALLGGCDLDNDALMRAIGPLKLDPASPRPSIETLMHACLPHRYVEHTHADSILAVINTEGGEASAAKLFGRRAPLVPFRHSGFDLAMACADVYRRRSTPESIGLLLAFHGVVAFGESARQSYGNLFELVRCAERHLQDNGAWDLPRAAPPERSWEGALRLARLRADLSVASGFPMVLTVDDSPEAVAFCRRGDARVLARIGPPTPQHAVFTKRFPALGTDVAGYAAEYRQYAAEHGGEFPEDRIPDPAPRILLDPSVGMIAASVNARHARMTANVYRHDIEIASRADALDRYVSLPAEAILAAEVHYGGFDRALLRRRADDLPLLGCVVALVGQPRPDIAEALARSGADVLSTMAADERLALDAAYSHGGLDVCVTMEAGSGPGARTESLLACSPSGGRVVPLAPATRAQDLQDTLARDWRAVTGIAP